MAQATFCCCVRLLGRLHVQHQLSAWCQRHSTFTPGAKQDAEAERTRKLAKVLTQTENPAVLKTVSSVLSGLQGIFGGKKAARKPDSGSSDKPGE
jgi:hypothetical protein